MDNYDAGFMKHAYGALDMANLITGVIPICNFQAKPYHYPTNNIHKPPSGGYPITHYNRQCHTRVLTRQPGPIRYTCHHEHHRSCVSINLQPCSPDKLPAPRSPRHHTLLPPAEHPREPSLRPPPFLTLLIPERIPGRTAHAPLRRSTIHQEIRQVARAPDILAIPLRQQRLPDGAATGPRAHGTYPGPVAAPEAVLRHAFAHGG